MLGTERLTHVEVARLWESRAEIFEEEEADLAEVSTIDSSGVAFLVQWAKARPEGRLVLRHSSHNLRSLIRTFHLEPLFELKDNL